LFFKCIKVAQYEKIQLVKILETIFEGALWNSRFVIIAAVIGSLLAGFAIFYMATVDVVNLFLHALHYADSSLTDEARKALHDSTVSHIVEVVDAYLLATVISWTPLNCLLPL
jgi:uncharacterized membrane protein YqhA